MGKEGAGGRRWAGERGTPRRLASGLDGGGGCEEKGEGGGEERVRGRKRRGGGGGRGGVEVEVDGKEGLGSWFCSLQAA